MQAADGQFCRLVGTRTAVIQEEQERVVTSAKGSALIWLLQQGIDLGLFEVPDRRFGGLLEGNRPYLAAPSEVGRRVRAYEPRQRVDHGKPLVARHATAMPIAFEVIKELTNNRRRQILDCHSVDGMSGAGTGERQQQGQRVTVAGLGVAREIAFGHQVLQEEASNPGANKLPIIHDGSPTASSLRNGGSLPGGARVSFADSAAWT